MMKLNDPTIITVQQVWDLLETVSDPEIPVISIVDLGIVRKVALMDAPPLNDTTALNDTRSLNDQGVVVTITPTYTGCPAMDMIAVQVRMALMAAGFTTVKIVQELSPAWTTDWMSAKGKEQLQQYGIAPPIGRSIDQTFLEDLKVPCPQCGSVNTVLVSQFGSTSCKALFKCCDCKEPFDYFKCH